MAGSWSTEIRQGWADEIEALTISMALFSSDPRSVSTPASVEIIGATYARQDSGVWTRTGPTQLTLSTGLAWRGIPPGAVLSHVGGFDDAFGGRFLFADALPAPVSYPSGGTYVLPAGEFVLEVA